MKKAIIFGLGDLAKMMFKLLHEDGEVEVVAFTVHQQYITEEKLFDLPIVGFEAIEEKFDSKEYVMYIAVGYNGMNQLRKSVYEGAHSKGYFLPNYIHKSAIIMPDVFWGSANIIMEKVTLGMESKIGSGNIFYPNSMVAHHTNVADFNFFAISASVAGFITVGNNCFFGNNCTIRDNIKIADYTLVGAGAYVLENTNEYDVIVPARSITLTNKKSRDLI